MDHTLCERCGAPLPPPGPTWTCSHCHHGHTPPPLAQGQIWLTEEGIVSHLRQALVGVDSTFLYPSIPSKKVVNVRKVHSAHLASDETLLGMYDGTAFGSANDGWSVTTRGLYFKNQMEQPGFLAWGEMDEHDIYTDDSTLRVGRIRLDTLFGPEEDGLWAWSDVLMTLARSAKPGVAPQGASDAPSAPDAAWGGPEVLVPGAVAGAGWGGMSAAPAVGAGVSPDAMLPELERLAQAPYQLDRNASVVDVHPSGEIFAACGSGNIELRYAKNGARYLAMPSPEGVLSARFSPDGKWLLVGCMDNRTHLFEVRTLQHRGASPQMEDYCDQAEWLGATSSFAMASQRGEVWIVDGSSMTVTERLLGPDPDYNRLGGIAITTDGSRLYAMVGRRLGAFDVGSRKIAWRIDEAMHDAARLSVSGNGQTLIAASHEGVGLFDGATGRPLVRYQFPCPRNVTWPERSRSSGFFGGTRDEDGVWSWSPRPRFSPSGEAVAVQDHVGNLCFVDIAHGGALHPTPRAQGRAWIEDVAWFADGNHVLCTMSDNSVAIWQARPLTGVMHSVAIEDLPESAYASATYRSGSDVDYDDYD